MFSRTQKLEISTSRRKRVGWWLGGRWGNSVWITGIRAQLVAHACNPSYIGGSDQEDHSSKPAGANSSGAPILKILST
jgi:hypothetical protein